MKRLFSDKMPSNSAALSCLQVPSSVRKLRLALFRPSPELISKLKWALLPTASASPLTLNAKNAGQFEPTSNISFDFSNDWTWTIA